MCISSPSFGIPSWYKSNQFSLAWSLFINACYLLCLLLLFSLPYTLNSFMYFIFLVLDSIGKSYSTDRMVVEHFPCHSKNVLLKKHKNKKSTLSPGHFKWQIEHWAIAPGFEKTWCWSKDSPSSSTPVIPVSTLGDSNRGRGRGADGVGSSHELQWLTTSLQFCENFQETRLCHISVDYSFSRTLFKAKNTLCVWEVHLEWNSFLVSKLWVLKKKFSLSTSSQSLRGTNSAVSIVSIYFSLSWGVPRGLVPRKYKLELCLLLVSNAR